MGKFMCQHEPPLIRWEMREDEMKTVERGFGVKSDRDTLCLRRENVYARDKKTIVGCVLVGIPAEQPHLIRTAAAKLEPEAVETDITEPAAPKKTRKKKGA